MSDYDNDSSNNPEIPSESGVSIKDNSDSILICTKKLCGITEEDTSFDVDMIVNINSALFALTQLGIGPRKGFQITGSEETFSNFLGKGNPVQGAVSQYIYIKTQLGFDVPSSSAVTEQLNQKAKELEFRLIVSQDEPYKSDLNN